MQFVIAHRMYLCLPEIDYGMYRVLLQNTFQSSMPLLNAFFGLIYSCAPKKRCVFPALIPAQDHAIRTMLQC